LYGDIEVAGHALIIEDEALIALELESHLTDLGYSTFDVAVSPLQAVAAAQARRPDLITADYRILDGTGVEAVAAIFEAIGPVPLLYVTGNPDAVSGQVNAPIVDKPISVRSLAKAFGLLSSIAAR
jgi:CheY-like chemotaxis protein